MKFAPVAAWGNRGAGGDYIESSSRYEQPRLHETETNYHPEAKASKPPATAVHSITRDHASVNRHAPRKVPLTARPDNGTISSMTSR